MRFHVPLSRNLSQNRELRLTPFANMTVSRRSYFTDIKRDEPSDRFNKKFNILENKQNDIRSKIRKNYLEIQKLKEKIPESADTSLNILYFGEDYKECLEEQYKNEKRGYIEVENILPSTLKEFFKKDEEILKIYYEWTEKLAKEISSLIPTLSDKPYYPLIGKTDVDELSRFIMEWLLRTFLTNVVGLPIYYLKRALGKLWFKHSYFKHHESIKYIKSIKLVHSKFIEQLNKGKVDDFIQTWINTAQSIDQRIFQKYSYFPDTDIIDLLGGFMIECIINSAPLFRNKLMIEYVQVQNNGIPYRKKSLADANSLGIKKRAAQLFHTLLYDQNTVQNSTDELPMLVPAVPIYDFDRGGYVTELNNTLIRGQTCPETFIWNRRQVENRQLRRFLNILSSNGLVGWRINTKILDIQLELFKQNLHNPNLHFYCYLKYPRDKKLLFSIIKNPKNGQITDNKNPSRFFQQKTNEIFSLWSNLHKNLVAASYLRDKRFFIPFNIDFRGRFYPIPNLTHYYTSDNFRALLLFEKSLPLGPKGLYILKLHLSNMMGSHKKFGFSQRELLINEMIPLILDTAKEPLKHTWWMDQDEPWQVLATSIEIANAINSGNPITYHSSFPIHQDGTCNGLQHYAAMGRSVEEASFVNLAQRDFHTEVYGEVSQLVKMSSQNPKLSWCKQHWWENANRKNLKQTIMTFVYGITLYGAQRQIRSKVEQDDFLRLPQNKKLLNFLVANLAYLTLSLIKLGFRNANKIMGWLKSYSKKFSYRGRFTVHKTPLNLIVVQPYLDKPKNLNEPSSVTKYHVCKVNKRKQANAFPPNFVHSLDACHMAMTQAECLKNEIIFAAVHDSFWTHPCTVYKMNQILREEFASLYEYDILKNLVKNGHRLIKSKKRLRMQSPTRGTMHPTTARDAIKFFS